MWEESRGINQGLCGSVALGLVNDAFIQRIIVKDIIPCSPSTRDLEYLPWFVVPTTRWAAPPEL